MIDYTGCNIVKLSVHTVGNKNNGDELHLSKSIVDISGEKVRELLFKYFLNPFSNPEYHSFTFSNGDFSLNPVYSFASDIFNDIGTFHRNSVNLAQLLFDLSIHPQIKSGDLFIAYLTSVAIGEEVADAIGIFKSENRQSFLKVDSSGDDFSVLHDDGINIEKLDKGCLIFNTSKETGFKICIVDKSNKSSEALYWKESFLNLKPCSDDYHFTKEFMNITKNFVANQLPEDFEVNKADRIDLLNRSVEYFKSHEVFEKNEFEEQVFRDNGLIESFRNYDESYREENNIELSDSFGISSQAVKKQAKAFKSVLKLDKNFHIYIHGDRDLIEHGVDNDGRKFYKIYYREES